MKKLKMDFFSMEPLLQMSLQKQLEGIPHKLSDTFQMVLSANGDETLLTEEHTLLVVGLPAAKIKLQAAQKNLLPFLQNCLQEDYEKIWRESDRQRKELIAQDIESIFSSTGTFENQLIRLMKFCRTHLSVEECGIFGMEDGFSIEGIGEVGYENKYSKDGWMQEYAAVVSIAISTQQAYYCPDPKKEKRLKPREVGPPIRNFLCLPLVQEDDYVGAIYFVNKMFNAWCPEDRVLADRFAGIAASIVQKQFYKRSIENLTKTSEQLGKYLSKKVKKNVKQSDGVEIGGLEKKVVCLFSDIRSFTTITEGIPASTLVVLLNYYFEKMSAVIENHEGALDKIVGDLIMAVWNIPHDQPEPELLAMKCAIEMQKTMNLVVAPEWQKAGVKNVGMGIGVNAGLAVAGNLGSSRFMNYTVVGDSINTAQRLEAKAAGGEIWMAESLFPAVDGKIEKFVRKETDIKLKGKNKVVNAYVYQPGGKK
jgi:class 3 adenylate cyclase